MKLYKAELYKILKRKSTWITVSAILLLILVIFLKQVNLAHNILSDLGKNAGYRCFFNLSEMFFVISLFGVIILCAPYFCEDKQYKVDVLILTTKNGRFRDFITRLEVVFTLTFGLFIFALIFAFLISSVLYGFSSRNTPLTEIFLWPNGLHPSIEGKSVHSFVLKYLFTVFSAFIMLDSIIVFISTMSKKTMNSLIIATVFILLPVMLEDSLKNNTANTIYIFVTGQPILLMTIRSIRETWITYGWHIMTAYTVSLLGICTSAIKWCSFADE